MVNLKTKKRIFAILAMFTLLLSGIAGFTNSYSSASAFNFCGDISSNSKRSGVAGTYFSDASNPDKSDREWTVEEIFRSSVKYSRYYGEHEGDFIRANTADRGEGMPGYADAKERLQDTTGCMPWSGISDTMANTAIGMSQIITGLTGSIIMFLVGKDTTSEVLMEIVGGTGASDKGLIGTFFDGFYMPLVTIAAIIMIVTIIYKGLIQFKLREALGSLLWSLGAFIIGVALMLNPQLLAGAPQAATSTITTCVIGAISGQNCLTGDIEAPSVLASRECVSSVSDGDNSESIVSSLNCMVWKSFVLEPWAEVQFGEPYNDLYTKNKPKGGSIWSNLPDDEMMEEANDYCVNFSSSKSFEASKNKTVQMDGGGDAQVCNAALYHLFLKTDMKDTTAQKNNNFGDEGIIKKTESGKRYDSRWYHLAIPMTADETKWDSWRGENGGAKHSTSFVSLVAIIASASVLLVLSVFGGAYKVIGTVLIAFAPVFLLFAIEPTRGRKIFLGWLESLVSSILKYFAVAVMVIVALVMYAGLLSNTTGITSLVGIIVLTVALHMYRKEIVDLIGATNMGGQRLSNKAAEVGDKAGKQFKEKSSAAVGGAIGGAAGSMLNRRSDVKSRKKTESDLKDRSKDASRRMKDIDEKIANESDSGEIDKLKDQKRTIEEEKEFYDNERNEEKDLRKKESKGFIRGNLGAGTKGAFSGTGSSFKRSMKRGTGMTANVFQQSDRTKSSLGSKGNERLDNIDEENRKRREEFEAKRIANQVVNKPVKSGDSNNELKLDSDVSHSEMTLELEKQRNNIEPIKKDPKLTPEESMELDKFAKELNEGTDEDIARALNDEKTMQDPAKKAEVNRELQARLETRAAFNMSVGALGGHSQATSGMSEVELSKVSARDAIEFKNLESSIIENTQDDLNREVEVNDYGETLRDAGVSRENVNTAKEKLYKLNDQFKDGKIREIDEKIYASMKSGKVEGYEDLVANSQDASEVANNLYLDSVSAIENEENITPKTIVENLRNQNGIVVTEEVAQDVIEQMKIKQDVKVVSNAKGQEKIIVQNNTNESNEQNKEQPDGTKPDPKEKEQPDGTKPDPKEKEQSDSPKPNPREKDQPDSTKPGPIEEGEFVTKTPGTREKKEDNDFEIDKSAWDDIDMKDPIDVKPNSPPDNNDDPSDDNPPDDGPDDDE